MHFYISTVCCRDDLVGAAILLDDIPGILIFDRLRAAFLHCDISGIR